jgi:hypothetical protein
MLDHSKIGAVLQLSGWGLAQMMSDAKIFALMWLLCVQWRAMNSFSYKENVERNDEILYYIIFYNNI